MDVHSIFLFPFSFFLNFKFLFREPLVSIYFFNTSSLRLRLFAATFTVAVRLIRDNFWGRNELLTLANCGLWVINQVGLVLISTVTPFPSFFMFFKFYFLFIANHNRLHAPMLTRFSLPLIRMIIIILFLAIQQKHNVSFHSAVFVLHPDRIDFPKFYF